MSNDSVSRFTLPPRLYFIALIEVLAVFTLKTFSSVECQMIAPVGSDACRAMY